MVITKYYRKMKPINPYDLGGIVENTQGVRINDLLDKAKELGLEEYGRKQNGEWACLVLLNQ